MSVFSQMTIQVSAGARDSALAKFRARRIFEECAETIPGFVQAFLLADRDDPDSVSVISEWVNAEDYFAWLQSPVRAAQEQDLVEFIAAKPVIRLLDRHL